MWKLLFLSMSLSVPAFAQDVSSCDAALAKDALRTSSEVKSDYRLAQLLDESTYDERKRDASANAKIYDVPVGSSYSEYQANARALMQSRNESLSKTEARSIAWLGLSGTSADAYKACLDTLGGNDKLTISASHATESFAVLKVRWRKSRFGPEKVTVRWTASNGGDVSQFPTQIAASDNPIRIQVRRPPIGRDNLLLTANVIYNGDNVDSAEVIIAPYRRPIPPPPRCPAGVSASWSDGGNGSVIEQMVPNALLGCNISIAARADAQGFGSNTGQIQIVVETLSPEGWVTHCSTARIPGSGNINTSLRCSFKVPDNSQKIRITAPNWSATAQGVSASVNY